MHPCSPIKQKKGERLLNLSPFLAILFFALTSFFPHTYAAPETAILAEDISDRAYLERVINLIQNAKSSIDVAMFAIQYQAKPDDPASRLLTALGEAAKSGKKVRLWLNTRQASIGTNRVFMRADIQQGLLRQGLRIFYVDKSRRLHDKLLVIDRKTVIEGSMNWTREALLKNYESASLIHSPKLAAQKIKRLEAMPAEEQTLGQPAPDSEITFSFPLKLLTDPKIFPAALEGSQIRSLGLYLLLLAHAHNSELNQFQIGFEAWGERLPFKKKWVGPSLRHEMRRTLNFLKDYGLLEWQALGKDAALITLPAAKYPDNIPVPITLIQNDYIQSLKARELFVYLIVLRKAQISGNVPFWLGSIADVSKEFHLNPVTLIRGLWELRRQNLIEIYPSEKKLVNGVWQREFTNRYQLNPLETPAQRATRFDGLAKKFGKEQVDNARRFADAMDDPNDPEVVQQFLHLMKAYPEKEVAEAVRIVAGYNRNNALRTPAYVRGILEGNLK